MGILIATLAGLATAWVLVRLIGRCNDRRLALQPVPIRTLPAPRRPSNGRRGR